MSSVLLDPYIGRDSPIHRADARIKLALTLLLIMAANLTPLHAWPVLMGYLLLLGVAALAGRLPPGKLVRRALVVMPFALIAAAGLPFVREGRPLASLPLGPWTISVTEVGLSRFGNVVVKAVLSLLAALTLALTTPMPDTIRAMQALGMPRVLAAIILLMYRYLFVLLEETQRMMRARAARSAELPGQRTGGTLGWRAAVSGRMVGTLFLRTTERSERIYAAMLARGFDGTVRTLPRPAPGARELWLAGGVALVILLAAAAANLWW